MEIARQVLAVVFVLVLLGTALWALRRGAGPVQMLRRSKDKTRALQIIERVALTPQHSLHVVRAGACEWVLATHPQGCTVISEGKASGGCCMKRVLAALALTAGSGIAATPPDSLLGITLVQNKGGASVGVPMQIVLLLTLLTLLPAILMSITPFLRITVVLHFLRQALGTQSTPSNQVLVGLALFLSLIVVQPVATQVYELSWQPLEAGKISTAEAWDQASGPLKTFLLRFAREKDIQLFMQLSHAPAPATSADVPITALMPAYVLSELKAAFQIGAVLFLPFLIIDLVVASVTLSVGMVQLPPVMVSAPFKILLFVLVDGWNLVIGSLVRSFY